VYPSIRRPGSLLLVEYLVVDATDEERMLALGEERFDAAVCNMALMDMPVIDPLMRALRRLLKPEGRFVFSVQHPAFNSNAVRLAPQTPERAVRGLLQGRLRGGWRGGTLLPETTRTLTTQSKSARLGELRGDSTRARRAGASDLRREPTGRRRSPACPWDSPRRGANRLWLSC
jgi:SAM-dependent methyltransferase